MDILVLIGQMKLYLLDVIAKRKEWVAIMKQLKRWFAFGAIFVLIAGTLSHFLYGWTGKNFFVGLFSPVSESVWEHMKLLFFPMLLVSFALAQRWKGEFPCIAPALCFGILAGTFFIPAFFYGYTAVLGKDIFFLDIVCFFLSAAVAVFTAYRLALSCRLQKYARPLCWAVWALFLCFLVFTYHPPEFALFRA